MSWTPLGMQSNLHDTLHEGIPPWMDQPFWDWASGAVDEALDTFGPVRGTRVDIAQEFDRLTRTATPFAPGARTGYGLDTQVQRRGDADEALRLADYLIYKVSAIDRTSIPDELEYILVSCGSAWTVGHRGTHRGLQRRVPEGVQVAVEEAISTTGSPGQILAEAWHAAFGRTPDPEEAYEKAIKAVEEAGAHIVSPANSSATLGTMVRDMDAQKDWTLPLTEVTKHPSRDALVRVARMLWSGQESRHGGNGYRKPTQEEAESAVLLAVTLVQAFTAGLLGRRP